MLSWFFPRICELCGEPCAQELCSSCISELPRVPHPICLYCGAPVSGEQVDPYHCRSCSSRSRSYDFARSALLRAPSSMQLVYRLKYGHANYLAPVLGSLLNELWEDTPSLLAHDEWALVPVPSAPGHLYSRGFNQAEELALALARLRGLRVLSPLARSSKGAESQTRLAASERRLNALKSYTARRAWRLGRKRLPSHIVIVDDVYTTGSTVHACARALKELPGVETVAVITLLRATLQSF